jgi:hypothetical protein
VVLDRLAQKYGMSAQQAKDSQAHLTAMAAEEGLDFRFDQAQSGNSFDAHRLLHLAGEHGLQGALKDRLFRAYFTEGEAIGEPEPLRRLALEAVALGVSGVPSSSSIDGSACPERNRLICCSRCCNRPGSTSHRPPWLPLPMLMPRSNPTLTVARSPPPSRSADQPRSTARARASASAPSMPPMVPASPMT